MSSRVAEKQRLREEREERERTATSQAQRKRRLGLLGAAVLVAAVAVAVAIALSSSGGSSGSGAKASKPAATTQLFAGIPQRGVVLGKANAPVTLTEFADLQCPVCKAYTLDVLPTLVRRYVRTGKVRMVFRNISILGPDSRTAAEAAAAAGLQNSIWQFADRFYHDQRAENSGYVTDGFVKQVAAQVPGLNAARLLSQRNSAGAQQQLATATTESQVRGVNATPTFFLGRTGGSGKELQPTALTPDQFTGPIDKQLASR
jgi:protein-disulfide isomerase